MHAFRRFEDSSRLIQYIDRILAKVSTEEGDEYRVRWNNYTEQQATMVPRTLLSRAVQNPSTFFSDIDEKLLNGETPVVSIRMDAPPSAWRWRCAWMHLTAPRSISGYQNRHLKLSDSASYFIHTVLGLGLANDREDNSDNMGVQGQAIREEYNRSQDHNSGMPRKLSNGVMALLDGTKQPGLGVLPKTPVNYDKVTDVRPPDSGIETNPYEILLSTSGGQYVEVSNLASYLGTGVHVASAVKIKESNEFVGDGFSDYTENFDTLRRYVSTLPPLCRSLGNTMVISMGDTSLVSSVETMMHWCFGLVKNDRFVVTRADATGVDNSLNTVCVHEFKTKWTTSIARAQNFLQKPLPRDLRQALLNCIMMAHARSVPQPWTMISSRIHYVKPKSTTPESAARTTRHTV